MEILIGASLIAAFIAGTAALFAPCCITVLLPSYLGSVFRQKKTVFLMTFLFSLGMFAVFLPLGLGAAGLGQLFRQNHNFLFVLGGLFVLVMGISVLTGIHFSLPFSIKNRNMKVKGAGSVFVLGIFSAFATLCCAPVLAGVIALSALPGSLFWGGMYSLVYVLGMAVPLFLIALFLDKANITEKITVFRKNFSYSIAGRQVNIFLADIISGVTFFLMGILILYLAATGQLAMSPGGYQMAINIYSAKFTNFLSQYLGQAPAIIWVAAVAGLVALIAITAIVKWKKQDNN